MPTPLFLKIFLPLACPTLRNSGFTIFSVAALHQLTWQSLFSLLCLKILLILSPFFYFFFIRIPFTQVTIYLLITQLIFSTQTSLLSQRTSISCLPDTPIWMTCGLPHQANPKLIQHLPLASRLPLLLFLIGTTSYFVAQTSGISFTYPSLSTLQLLSITKTSSPLIFQLSICPLFLI